jgi:hypothetical protein
VAFLYDETFLCESNEMLIQQSRKLHLSLARSDKMCCINSPGERWPSQRVP